MEEKGRSSLQLQVLSQREREEIHYGVQELLQEVGISIPHEGALQIFKKAGIQVSGDKVFFFSSIIDRSLRSAPSAITLANQRGEPEIYLKSGHQTYTGLHVSFHPRREKGSYVGEELGRLFQLLDALPHFDFLMDPDLTDNGKDELSSLEIFGSMMKNSTKTILYRFPCRADYEKVIEISISIAKTFERHRENPYLSLFIGPTDSFKEALDKIIFLAPWRIPIVYSRALRIVKPGQGSLSTLIENLAEILTALVISQLISEGTPFIIGGVPLQGELCTTRYLAGGFHLLGAAFSEMGYYYQVPVLTGVGNINRKSLEGLSILEFPFSSFRGLLSAANLIYGQAYLEDTSWEELGVIVLYHQSLNMVKEMQRNYLLNSWEKELKEFKEAGLDTLSFQKSIGEREGTPSFQKKEKVREEISLLQRGALKAKEILVNHQLSSLPSALQKMIDEGIF